MLRSLPAPTAEYVAALAEIGAACLDERARRTALVADNQRRPGADEDLRLRASWRMATVRVERAVDRLELCAGQLSVKLPGSPPYGVRVDKLGKRKK